MFTPGIMRGRNISPPAASSAEIFWDACFQAAIAQPFLPNIPESG